MTPRLYIVVPVHNRKEVTRTFITCLLNQSFQEWHLLLIDDGSEDGTSEMAAGLTSRLTIIRGDGNWWWARSLQKGIDWIRSVGCSGDTIVLIINDDTVFDAGFLEQGVEKVMSGPDQIVKPYGYDSVHGHLVDAGIRFDWFSLTGSVIGGEGEADCFSTRGIYLSCATLMKIGSFYPWLLPHYLSDYEFTIRAKRKGVRFAASPSLSLRTPDPAGNFGKMPDRCVDRIRFMISNRCHRNPIHWLLFVWMAVPWRWKLWGTLLVCYRGLSDLTGWSLPFQLGKTTSTAE